ncbi:MAG: twitch domain-containing radical SAM protein, partial [Halobacteriovoraceae bacterium]|nr:twitch domain-containing radical SAM protein [Halobacteriovoraceae bacterium]
MDDGNNITVKNDLSDDFSATPSFCVYPWMQFIIGPDRYAKICCIADGALLSDSNKSYPMDEMSLSEIWNGEGIRNVRKKMLAGEKIKNCKRCYYLESIGQESYRQIFNKVWLKSLYRKEIIKRVLNSKSNNFLVESPPLYLDIRLGNKCNLKCRMCNPINSSKIYQEQKELFSEKKDLGLLIDKSFLDEDEHSFHNWHQSPQIWKIVYQWLPSIRKLYFTGGEPTLIKKNWELISYLQDKGYSKKIILDFNINCT